MFSSRGSFDSPNIFFLLRVSKMVGITNIMDVVGEYLLLRAMSSCMIMLLLLMVVLMMIVMMFTIYFRQYHKFMGFHKPTRCPHQ